MADFLRCPFEIHLTQDKYLHRKVPPSKEGLVADVFSFVDASQIIFKVSLWEDRDKAIKAKAAGSLIIKQGVVALMKDGSIFF